VRRANFFDSGVLRRSGRETAPARSFAVSLCYSRAKPARPFKVSRPSLRHSSSVSEGRKSSFRGSLLGVRNLSTAVIEWSSRLHTELARLTQRRIALAGVTISKDSCTCVSNTYAASELVKRDYSFLNKSDGRSLIT
jgi:hypothetical protein